MDRGVVCVYSPSGQSTLVASLETPEFIHGALSWLEDEEVSTYEDDEGMIGWLNPKGNFFPCQFGEHVLYANQLLQRIRKEDIDTLAENQHIPMSIDEKSNYEHIGILGDITPEQITWFNRFFDKLSRMQKSAIMSALEKQGKKLEFAW